MRPLWGAVWAVLRKELVDGIRDRRSVMSALIPPLMWPLMIVLMLNFIAEKRRQADDIELPIVGPSHAETLVDWLKQQRGVEVVDGPQDPYTAVRDGDVKFVIVIPEDYNELFAQSKAVEVELVIDRSDDDAGVFVRRARRLLSAYSGQIGMLRLVARGVSPAVAAPIRIDEVDVSSAQQRAAMVMAFLPMFLVLATFVGGMNIAIDTTAGERERGSLEPLLVNPAPRKSIVAGKWLASVVFAWVSVLLTFVLLQQAMERAPLESLGLRFQLDAGDVGALLAAVIPLAFSGLRSANIGGQLRAVVQGSADLRVLPDIRSDVAGFCDDVFADRSATVACDDSSTGTASADHGSDAGRAGVFAGVLGCRGDGNFEWAGLCGGDDTAVPAGKNHLWAVSRRQPLLPLILAV